MRLDGEQHKRAGRSPERHFRLPSPSCCASFSPANEEDAMLDAFAVSGTSPTYRYRVRELRYSVVREGDAPPRDLSSPISALCLIADLGERLLPDDGKEHFAILMLDTKNRLIAFHAVSTGTLAQTL